MSFSVVIVALDAAKDIALTIESILQQSFRGFEIIVLDGYSVDNTKDVIRRYANDIAVISREEDSGIFDAMNRAVRLCNNEYVIFMNARDRFYSKETLEKIWNRRIGNPDLIFGEHIYVDSGLERYVRAQRFDFIWQSLVAGDISARWHESVPCHQSTFTRRTLLKHTPYDTRLELCADHDFMFKCFSRGYRFQYIDEVVSHYFGGGLSAQRSMRLRSELVQTYRKHSKKPENVDRYFLGPDSQVYPNESASTGLRLTGFDLTEEKTEFERRHDVRWCYSRKFTVVTPVDLIAEACLLSGFNPFGVQQVELLHEGTSIGRLEAPHGRFSIIIDFDRPLYLKSTAEFVMQYYSSRPEAHGRAVSVALDRIVYSGPSFLELPLLSHGDSLDIGRGDLPSDLKFLSVGWSTPEADRVWSVSTDAFVYLRVSNSVTAICVEMSGNPYVDPEESEIEIEVNGRVVLNLPLAMEKTSLIIKREDGLWETEAPNLLVFRVRSIKKPPADERTLGVCLYRIWFS